MRKIAIAGTGYVGLVTGACLSEIGHNVTCVDIDDEKVKTMEKGITPIYEEGLEELMKRNIKKGRLSFTTDYVKAYKDAEVIFIAVGTPEREDGLVHLEYVYTVAKQISESIKNDTLIVVKSTVPIGTNDEVEKIIKENLKHDVNIEVVSNPEFLSQGTAVRDALEASRIVIGVKSKEAENILREIYKGFNQPIVCTDRRSAEMIKYASNNFLALKLSFINDIANLCDLVGGDIEDVARGMSYDSRIGDKFLCAGIGYGGSCFPKDSEALYSLAKDYGYDLRSVKAAIDINKDQGIKLIEKARHKIKSFQDLNVGVLGLTFKPGTDDLRGAPSIPNIKILLQEGANIKAYDPVGIENYKKLFQKRIHYVNTPEDALKDSDVVFIFTEWEEIKELDLIKFRELMRYPLVYDGRNCFDPAVANEKGIEYHCIGRLGLK